MSPHANRRNNITYFFIAAVIAVIVIGSFSCKGQAQKSFKQTVSINQKGAGKTARLSFLADPAP